LAFSRFDAGAQVVQRDVFAVHFDTAAENGAVDFVAFVSYQG
jgi:hypothetical protein